MVEQNLNHSKAWFQNLRKLADDGNAEAAFFVGMQFGMGDGEEQSLSECMRWISVSAKGGYPDAQLGLGAAYEHGDGVKQDMDQAIRWYRAAAEQDEPTAQTSLGVIYAKEENFEEAKKWFTKAARQGSKDAMEYLNSLPN